MKWAAHFLLYLRSEADQLQCCETSDCHDDKCEGYCPLGRDAMKSGTSLHIFRKKTQPPFSG
jgi:hypothetical protein